MLCQSGVSIYIKNNLPNFKWKIHKNKHNFFESKLLKLNSSKANKKGYEIYIAFIIQREDCNQFAIASDIDPEYSKLLSKAVKKKLNILCYDCKFSSKGIKLNKEIKFKT